MARASDIINKLMGAGLLLASTGFFIESFDGIGHPVALIPALLFGGGGFWLAARRERQAGPDMQAQQQLDQLASGLTATQAELGVLHEQLERLNEERDFMRQLATPGGAPGLPAGTRGTPADTTAAGAPPPRPNAPGA